MCCRLVTLTALQPHSLARAGSYNVSATLTSAWWRLFYCNAHRADAFASRRSNRVRIGVNECLAYLLSDPPGNLNSNHSQLSQHTGLMFALVDQGKLYSSFHDLIITNIYADCVRNQQQLGFFFVQLYMMILSSCQEYLSMPWLPVWFQ